MSEIKQISEKDKPFVLALVGSAITVLNIVTIAIGAWTGKTIMVENGMEALKFTFTLTTVAWSFYFGKKS